MSREINLGNGLVTLVDDEDFDWVSEYSWHFKPHGGCIGYARTAIRVGERTTHYVLHRLMIRARPLEMVDHINRDGLDNRKANLRFCTPALNMVNRVNVNKTGFRGVKPKHNKFAAEVTLSGVTRRGPPRFAAAEAARDYDVMAKEMHGDFAILNFPVQS